MRRRGRGDRGARGRVMETPELLPLMNVFIAIIPMLLITAVFLEVQAIRMHPGETLPASTAEPAEVIAIVLEPDAWRVERSGQAVARIVHAEDTSGARLVAVLRECAREASPRKDVQVLARPQTAYHEVVRAMDLARAAGLSEASLGEQSAPGGS